MAKADAAGRRGTRLLIPNFLFVSTCLACLCLRTLLACLCLRALVVETIRMTKHFGIANHFCLIQIRDLVSYLFFHQKLSELFPYKSLTELQSRASLKL